MTEKIVAPDIALDETVPADLRTSWPARLRRELEAAGLHLDTPGAPCLEVRVHVEVGEGRTDAGVAYVAARAVANLRLFRARVTVTAPPSVAVDRERAIRATVDALLERVEGAIAW